MYYMLPTVYYTTQHYVLRTIHYMLNTKFCYFRSFYYIYYFYDCVPSLLLVLILLCTASTTVRQKNMSHVPISAKNAGDG